MTAHKTPTNAERLAAIDAQLAKASDAAAAKRAKEAKDADDAATRSAAAREEAERPIREELARTEALLAQKASLEATIRQDAIFAAHEAAESVKEAAFANAASALANATFGGTVDFAAVAAVQLSAALGVEVPAAVFTLSSDAGVVNAAFWGLTFTGQVSRDAYADVWQASITGTTYAPDGVTVRHTGSVTSPLDLALLLAGSPRFV